MSAVDFLNAAAGEGVTAALARKLRDAGNVFDAAGIFSGTASFLFVLLGEAPGFTQRQRELFAQHVPDVVALHGLLLLCREECERGERDPGSPRVVLHQAPRTKVWRIEAPAFAEPAPELRYTLRLCFDTAEDLARFEGWLAGQMALPFCKPADGIRRVTTGGRRLYQEGEG